MSIHPSYQELFLSPDLPREQRIDTPVATDVLDRLRELPEFVRSYEPDGMAPSVFVGFGATQRTLCQFSEMGWKLMETCR
jgi:transaldolase